MTRAILFDVDGVLIHGRQAKSGLRRRWDENLLADLGIDPSRLQDEFFARPSFLEVLEGRRSLVDALSDALPHIGFRGSPLQLIDYWMRNDAQVAEPALDIARELRADHCKLYLATNQEHTRAYHLWTTLGFKHNFEDMFYSARLGTRKPSRAFFERIAAHLGPQAQPPLLIDDQEAIVVAAREFGWSAILYESPDQLRKSLELA